MRAENIAPTHKVHHDHRGRNLLLIVHGMDTPDQGEPIAVSQVTTVIALSDLEGRRLGQEGRQVVSGALLLGCICRLVERDVPSITPIGEELAIIVAPHGH